MAFREQKPYFLCEFFYIMIIFNINGTRSHQNKPPFHDKSSWYSEEGPWYLKKTSRQEMQVYVYVKLIAWMHAKLSYAIWWFLFFRAYKTYGPWKTSNETNTEVTTCLCKEGKCHIGTADWDPWLTLCNTFLPPLYSNSTHSNVILVSLQHLSWTPYSLITHSIECKGRFLQPSSPMEFSTLWIQAYSIYAIPCTSHHIASKLPSSKSTPSIFPSCQLCKIL